MSRGRKVPDFNDEDFPTEDPVAYVRAIRQRSLEHLIAMEELKELQQQLSECYYREGVNYLTKCRPLVEVPQRDHSLSGAFEETDPFGASLFKECSKRLNQWRAFVPPKVCPSPQPPRSYGADFRFPKDEETDSVIRMRH